MQVDVRIEAAKLPELVSNNVRFVFNNGAVKEETGPEMPGDVELCRAADIQTAMGSVIERALARREPEETVTVCCTIGFKDGVIYRRAYSLKTEVVIVEMGQFATWLNQQKEKKGFTGRGGSERLAEFLGMHKVNLSRFLTGARVPDDAVVAAMFQKLEVPKEEQTAVIQMIHNDKLAKKGLANA